MIKDILPYVPKALVYLFAKRYILDQNPYNVIKDITQTNQTYPFTTFNYLGENSDKEESINNRNFYYNMTKALNSKQNTISVKLSQIGLCISEEFAFDNLLHLLRTKTFIRLDMEDSSKTDSILKIYRAARSQYYNIGIVLQAYLPRTAYDLNHLPLSNIRLCKGIYNEPMAIQDPHRVNTNFINLIEKGILLGHQICVASHDPEILEYRHHKIHEFQFLYGVPISWQSKRNLSQFNQRTYMPFGEKWYPYCMRRLQENPKLISYVFNNLWS